MFILGNWYLKDSDANARKPEIISAYIHSASVIILVIAAMVGFWGIYTPVAVNVNEISRGNSEPHKEGGKGLYRRKYLDSKTVRLTPSHRVL